MLRRLDLQLDEHQFAGEMIAAGHVLDRHHVDQLQQLCVDLRNDCVRAGGDQRDAGYGGIVGGSDRQRLDVVAARKSGR
jgi:hypothetical protein